LFAVVFEVALTKPTNQNKHMQNISIYHIKQNKINKTTKTKLKTTLLLKLLFVIVVVLVAVVLILF
jgi:hypothetical protein